MRERKLHDRTTREPVRARLRKTTNQSLVLVARDCEADASILKGDLIPFVEERRQVDNRVAGTMQVTELYGDTVVTSVVEERPMVVRQLVLTKKVRVRLDKFVTTERQTLPVRKDRVVIDRIPLEGEARQVYSPASAPPDADDPAHPTD